MINLSQPPSYVNEKGVSWWLDADMSKIATEKLKQPAFVWVAQQPNGYRSLVVTNEREALFDAQDYETLYFLLEVEAKYGSPARRQAQRR